MGGIMTVFDFLRIMSGYAPDEKIVSVADFLKTFKPDPGYLRMVSIAPLKDARLSEKAEVNFDRETGWISSVANYRSEVSVPLWGDLEVYHGDQESASALLAYAIADLNRKLSICDDSEKAKILKAIQRLTDAKAEYDKKEAENTSGNHTKKG